jgi:hypothetical protein
VFVEQSVLSIKAGISEKALALFHKGIPAKIETIAKLVESNSFGGIQVAQPGGDTAQKKRKLDNAPEMLNTIVRVSALIKTELEEFVMNISTLKVWIQLQIPKVIASFVHCYVLFVQVLGHRLRMVAILAWTFKLTLWPSSIVPKSHHFSFWINLQNTSFDVPNCSSKWRNIPQ